MSNNLDRTRTIYPAQADPIRIVPLHLPDALVQPSADALALAAAPFLTYRNGPLLTTVEVCTIFWASAWQQGCPSPMTSQIKQFFDGILPSALINQLSEYSVPGRRRGPRAFPQKFLL